MDTRLEDALKFAEYRTTLNNQLSQLQHKAETQLLHSVNGGTFPITPELISFVSILLSKQEEAILLDKNNTPILIENLQDFFDTILDRYNEVTKDMHEEVSRIRKARSVKAVIGD